MIFQMGRREAEALSKAFRPDDEKPPKGFRVRSIPGEEGLRIEICREGDLSTRDLLTILSLLDEYSRLTESVTKLLKGTT